MEALVCGSAAILFILIYGYQVLNPGYTDWLLVGGDGTQHYIGSVAFRQSRWMFPLGLMDTINYPESASVIFTDSIPLLALFFKAIRFVFPVTWQYQGWWGLSCFILQAHFARKILEAYSENRLAIYAGTLLFTLSPAMIYRVFGHETLGAHWLILCALLLLIQYRSKFHEPKAALKRAAILGFIIPGIHMYFLLMCGIVLAGYAIYDILARKNAWTALRVLGAYVLSAAAMIFLLGGFSQGGTGATGLGEYAFDLNGFFNPMEFSDFVQNRAHLTGESFAYLGVCVLGLILLAAVHLMTMGKHEWRQRDRKLYAVYALIGLLSLAAALSPEPHYASHILCILPVPEFLLKLWSTFRATGRLVWPLYYLLMILGIAENSRHLKGRTLAVLLCACVLVQGKEMMPLYRARHVGSKTYVSSLQTGKWEQVIEQTGSKNLFVVGTAKAEDLCFIEYEMGALAVRQEMKMNRFWMAHGVYESHYLDYVDTDDPETIRGNLYVFLNQALCLGYPNLDYYLLDGYILGVPQSAGPLDLPEPDLKNIVFDGATVINGRDEDGVRTLDPGGISFGPYARLREGRHRIVVTGKGIDGCRINLNSRSAGDRMEEYVSWRIAEQEDDLAVIEAEVFRTIPDFELQLFNESGNTVVLYSLEVLEEEEELAEAA